jgi:hypothetical protein
MNFAHKKGKGRRLGLTCGHPRSRQKVYVHKTGQKAGTRFTRCMDCRNAERRNKRAANRTRVHRPLNTQAISQFNAWAALLPPGIEP